MSLDWRYRVIACSTFLQCFATSGRHFNRHGQSMVGLIRWTHWHWHVSTRGAATATIIFKGSSALGLFGTSVNNSTMSKYFPLTPTRHITAPPYRQYLQTLLSTTLFIHQSSSSLLIQAVSPARSISLLDEIWPVSMSPPCRQTARTSVCHSCYLGYHGSLTSRNSTKEASASEPRPRENEQPSSS